MLVTRRDLREVQLVDHVGDEVGQMVSRKPLLQGRGQQQLLVGIVGKVGLAQRRLNWFDARPIIPETSQQPFFSDTLLETLAHVGGSRWRIETEFETEQSDAGLGE